nr:diguanylate cyclase [uncultured Holophaga sp.]
MNILAISRHEALVERLRVAFEPLGHRVRHLRDAIQALMAEAWDEAHLILVDSTGDPLDGFRFATLLRGESRVLFQNIPIFLILDHTPGPGEDARLWEAGGDGFLQSNAGLHNLMNVLGPALEGGQSRPGGTPIPVLAAGFRPAEARKLHLILDHFGFEVRDASPVDAPVLQQELRAPILLVALGDGGQEALTCLRAIREQECRPYPILVGRVPAEVMMRRLILAGAREVISGHLSPSRLLHACRMGMEWLHVRCVQHEFRTHLEELRERRVLLEMETANLRTEVLTDPMTSLLNRRAFNQHLGHACNQWDRHRRPFTLILGDVDYFKLVNDRHGHLVGDRVLRELADCLRGGLRRSDLAFRIGGEEFAVLLAETALQVGLEVAQKLRARVAGLAVTLSDGSTIRPTMSFGVGEGDGRPAADLFLAVDAALYAAKHRGRNRVEAEVKA